MMTKNDKVKLAIYENKNLSEEDKISMIILYEEKAEDLTEKEKSANRIYLEAYKKATLECKKEINEIKKLINDHKYSEAKKQIEKTKGALKELEQIVDKTPSTLTNTAIAQGSKMLVNGLASFTLKSIVDTVLKDEKRMLANATDKFLDQSNLDDSVKNIAKKQVDDTFRKKPKLGDEITSEITWEMLKNGFSLIKGNNPVQDRNTFKNKAKKQIEKEIEILDKLSNRISKF